MAMTMQQAQTERQRPYSTSPPPNIANPQFTGVMDLEGQREKSYGTMNEPENKLKFIPEPVAALLGSIHCFIVLCVLLIFPILEVAIGAHYRDQCPINPLIPTYLVVTGACGMVSIVLTLTVVGTFIWCVKKENIAGSFILLCCIVFVFMILFLMSLFLFAWFIAGNVWVFSAKKNVVYDIGSPNYCHRTVYEFAFAMIIISYVLPVLSCCGSCFRTCLGSKKE